MKLEKILDRVNSLEKNSFIKIIDTLKSNNLKNSKEIDKILSESNNELKNVDSVNIANVFELIKKEFAEFVKSEFLNTTSQLDILIDIIIKDGNCILKQNWLAKLYEKELASLKKKIHELKNQLETDKSGIEANRKRDYLIYKACVETAYTNDLKSNRDTKITDDELSIILTLARKLDLSQEEIKLINYLIIPPLKMDIEDVVTSLKNIGIIFYSKKNNLIFVADEIVKVLREIREKEIADKYFRRVLKTFKEPTINLICKKHNIAIKDYDYDGKIKRIIREGISFKSVLENAMHKEGTSLNEKKKAINDLWHNGLKIDSTLRGSTVEEKIDHIVSYFDEVERDERVGISIEGYEQLIIDLNDVLPSFNSTVQKEFEMPEEFILKSENLLDYNIKPRDILDILPLGALKNLTTVKSIKSRGDIIQNILEAYTDAENLLIENFENIGARNLSGLRENGIVIKESELGLKFEEITKSIFQKLGFEVDERLKNQLNTKKDKIDILLNLGNSELIIIECKTVKESGYNKFSTVSRQIKSYESLAKQNGFTVLKSLLIAPEFSDEFINDCDLEFSINLSLITANSLVKILDGFRNSKHKQFPHQLFLKDVLIKEDRILKAIG